MSHNGRHASRLFVFVVFVIIVQPRLKRRKREKKKKIGKMTRRFGKETNRGKRLVYERIVSKQDAGQSRRDAETNPGTEAFGG